MTGELIEHLFRHQYGALVGSLVRMMGPANWELAEECAQDALLRALETWPFAGVPEQPAAWLTRVAKNRALDRLRRKRVAVREEALPAPELMLGDDTLDLIFLCCHPELPEESRIALTLKCVAGFSTREIARAFVAAEATVAQRIVRAKRMIAEDGLSFAMPFERRLGERLDSVCEVLYLIFSEGYAASEGERLLREDLCEEALRLGALLAGNASCGTPKVDALLAIFLLHAARLPGRMDGAGDLLTLALQDRSLWDRELIAMGLRRLERSGRGGEVSAYHLEAEIASLHAVAGSFGETDWRRMTEVYRALWELRPTPVVALNLAVAVSYSEGAAAALAVLDGVELPGYHLLPAVRADLFGRKGERERAAGCLRQALSMRATLPERRLLEQRLKMLST